MRKTIRKITPAILLIGYSIIAGGSLEDIGITIGIVVAASIIGGIAMVISDNKKQKEKRAAGLAKAEDLFGKYTDKVEYVIGKYILYDEPTHRILLENSVSDSRKLRELKTTKRAPRTKVTYKEETVTKTSTGSTAGRAVVGALIAGPVGAVVGGATAKKTTETKKTPEYHTIPGHYTIEVLDNEGNVRAKYSTSDEAKHEEVKSFLQRIIDKNLEPERIAHQIEAEENSNAIQAIDTTNIVVGSSKDLIKALLIDSTKTTDGDREVHILCPEVVAKINQGWGASFEKITVMLKNELLSKFTGISYGYTAGNFKNFMLDTHMMAKQIISQYGEPSDKAAEISYTDFTDDNNRIQGYIWSDTPNNIVKIDYIYEKGKYKYEFISEI